jgi:hypothetical protein
MSHDTQSQCRGSSRTLPKSTIPTTTTKSEPTKLPPCCDTCTSRYASLFSCTSLWHHCTFQFPSFNCTVQSLYRCLRLLLGFLAIRFSSMLHQRRPILASWQGLTSNLYANTTRVPSHPIHTRREEVNSYVVSRNFVARVGSSDPSRIIFRHRGLRILTLVQTFCDNAASHT